MTFPNQLTLLRIILTPLIVYTLTIESLKFRYAAFALFLLASLTDWYDGYIARRFNSVSNWGEFLDPLADKILVLSTFTAFFMIGEIQLWVVLIIAGRDLFITSLRVFAMQTNRPIKTSTFAKWKTAAQMGSIYFILIWLILQQVNAAEASGSLFWSLDAMNLVEKVMYIVVFVTALTWMHYLRENWQQLKGFAAAISRIFLPTSLS